MAVNGTGERRATHSSSSSTWRIPRVLRSRLGCETCKTRRVKCSEDRPICASCARLGLDCAYLSQSRPKPRGLAVATPDKEVPTTSSRARELTSTLPRHEDASHQEPNLSLVSLATEGGRDNAYLDNFSGDTFHLINATAEFNDQSRDLGWPHGDLMQMNYDGSIPLSPLWEGYGFNAPMWESTSADLIPSAVAAAADFNSVDGNLEHTTGFMVGADTSRQEQPENDDGNNQPHGTTQPTGRSYSGQQEDDCFGQGFEGDTDFSTQASSSPQWARNDHIRTNDAETRHLLSLFQSIVQPPASILIGGLRKWRRLQHYLVRLGSQCNLVFDSLVCVIEFLFIDEICQSAGQSRETRLSYIMDRRQSLLIALRAWVTDTQQPTPSTHEQQLGALFLLAWLEAMKDQDAHSTPFPKDLADAILVKDTDWNRSSRVLLSWLWSLDSKATHLTGERRLFSEQALLVLARHPYQVVISQAEDNDEDIENEALESTGASKRMPSKSYEVVQGRRIDLQPKSSLTSSHIKQIMLHSLLQPAIEWYMDTQAFCRKISSHDRHHRPRGTPDDEFAVIVASKQLEEQLWEIWDQRPAMISLSKDQLCSMLPTDLALRLHEVYSVHLACYWVLFVYLHRVVWWNLPHSATTTSALNRVWELFQQCYGEEIDGSKIVHPGLLWQVFLFGSECTDETHRTWSVQQLEGLASSKMVLQTQTGNSDGLPSFKMSAGVTRNAKRALLLLKELIRRQQKTKVRVDDRTLSMEMFGCYFSLV
ncbi:uncharacterized protein PV06_02466 [Exophiala oligosperma]|uniref:Zn(2)-C6 fungal-type domain-containing protein n=1 Tax=Exophiala oligosperma TaxID=215243 RepID=A0A0D2EFW6_9EURO|nr:uncharacterized protein PV06_02466 [Exophiala oligosperma]KIW46834.1 hypothetical protein PV06_02466 [Exophiala oligosperma]